MTEHLFINLCTIQIVHFTVYWFETMKQVSMKQLTLLSGCSALVSSNTIKLPQSLVENVPFKIMVKQGVGIAQWLERQTRDWN